MSATRLPWLALSLGLLEVSIVIPSDGPLAMIAKAAIGALGGWVFGSKVWR